MKFHIRISRTARGMSIGTFLALSQMVGVRNLDAQRPILGYNISNNDTGGPVETHMTPQALVSTPMTLKLTRVRLGEALAQIDKATHIDIRYTSAIVPVNHLVSLDIRDGSVGDALRHVLEGTGIVATAMNDGTIVLARAPHDKQEGGTIVGRVTDSASGAGIPNAVVAVQGAKASVLTDENGKFVVRDVPVGKQLLTVKLFGYKPASRDIEVREQGTTTVHLVLTPMATMLSGVVTTATGVQRKLAVGNDVTTLNVDSIMQIAPITSVTDLLEARVPGLTVLHSSGVPGDPSRIRLRGASSLTGNNDPIVIVDGVRVYASQSDARNSNLAPTLSGGSSTWDESTPENYAAPSPLDQIDPNSIETIEVFKGPSASAMYGSDAANGVIVITTKRGRSGPTHWSVALGAGVSVEPGDWPVNYYRFGYGTTSATGSPFCTWYDLGCTVDSIVAFQALNTSQYSVFADHGNMQSASASISGGVATLQYALTGTTTGNVGLLKLPGIEQQRFEDNYGQLAPYWMLRPDHYTASGGSGQLTVLPTTTATVTINSSLYRSVQQRSSLEQAVAQLEGVYINPLLLGTNPLLTNEAERATDEQLSSTNALTVRWQPLAWLPLTTTVGFNSIQRVDKAYIPYGVNSVSYGFTGFSADTTGHYGLGRGTSMDKTLNLGATIPSRLITMAIGGNYHEGSIDDFTATTEDLAPGVSDPTTFPDTSSSFAQSSATASTYGWYVEPRFNLHSRLFVSPGFRLDGGSASGSNAGLTGLPKIDLSWLAVDEEHARGPLTLLRPRVAFGYSGTQPAPTAKLRLLNGGRTPSVVNLNGTVVPATFLTSLGNTRLQPETSREIEGGLDATFWANRFQVTYTRFHKMRYNAIISIPVASSVYGSNQHINYNIGEVRNTGNELTLQAQLLQRRAVSWNVGVNWSNVNNMLVRLNESVLVQGQTVVDGPAKRNVPGYPLFSQWAYPMVSYFDTNGNGLIEADEVRTGDSLVYVGGPDPDYQMNVVTDLSLLGGRLNMHATFAYQNGMTQFNWAAERSGAFALLGNAPGASLAAQAALQTSGDGEAVVAVPGHQISLYQTVNALRLQDLSINYVVPPPLSRRFHIPRMRVAVQGSNLWLHTNYRGKDPNLNAFSTGNYVSDTGQLPQPRTWWLKLSVGN